MDIPKIKFYMEQELLDKIISVAKTMSIYDVADYILKLSDVVNTSKTYNKFFKTC